MESMRAFFSFLGSRKGRSTIRFAFLLAGVFAVTVLTGCENLSYGGGARAFDTVVVDAGHGAHDSGARSRAGSPEKMKALDISQRLARELRQAGFRVVMTRNSDVFVPLASRVAVSNRIPNSIFVSVHLNWSSRSAAQGLETYYYSARSRRLAQNIQREILRVYPANNRGVKFARFHVLRNNRRPAVLVECGFLSNPYEAGLNESASHRQEMAERIARGIINERRSN